jgi:hypothetical protein
MRNNRARTVREHPGSTAGRGLAVADPLASG